MNNGEAQQHVLIVFGATGDLAHRKLLPALFHLDKDKRRPRCPILGVARSQFTDEQFRSDASQSLIKAGVDAAAAREWCNATLSYQPVGEATAAAYRMIHARLDELESKHKLPGNRVMYLALPLPAFAPTVKAIGTSGLNIAPGWSRLVVEKPFGNDLASAKELNALIHSYFPENEVYRLDHYLGKETVQNLLVFRFGNALFEPLWNRDRVEKVEITVAEEIGIEGRGAFYEQAGAMRDFIQNHITQLLCLTAMEPPAAIESDLIANEKIKVLHSIGPITKDDAVFGQYVASDFEGKKRIGYHQEEGVAKDSRVETYAALRLFINNWRWQGVPFYIRTGKALPRKVSRIIISFRCPPVSVFHPFDACQLHSNRLEIALQPNEGFNLTIEIKKPGPGMNIETQNMRFRYGETFGRLPDAYETLLLDVIRGDRTLFVRSDEIEASWALYDALLKDPPPVQPYPAGTWGPPTTNKLRSSHGDSWINL